MKAKLLEKQKAFEMRRNGASLNDISLELGVSKASVSLWVRNLRLPVGAKERLFQKQKIGQLKSRESKLAHTEKILEQAAAFGREVVSGIVVTKDLSRLHAALLYWCEGEKSKNDKSLIFTNSDPLLVASFLRELRRGYEIDERNFRVCVHLHSYHQPEKQLLFWSKITTIPLAQFIKPYQKLNSGKRKRPGYAGCASVRYHDVRIARQVLAVARAFLNT